MCKDSIYVLQDEINRRVLIEKDFTKGEILNLSQRLDKLINDYYSKAVKQ